MPELPEVETVRRILESVLVGRTIVECEVAEDSIVLRGCEASQVQQCLIDRKVRAVGRIGKYFWIEFAEAPVVMAHLGMAGWVREIGAHTIRLREHGKVSMDDATGRPKFLKMSLTTEEGRTVVMTDGRRLSRIWVKNQPQDDLEVSQLGPDCYTQLPSANDLFAKLSPRKAPIKALLLNQALFAGVGNWIADEVLFHAAIRPSRLGCELSRREVEGLRQALEDIIGTAVDVSADSERFPESWLFHKRWGGKSGEATILGQKIEREQVGGRTTAWVPTIQK